MSYKPHGFGSFCPTRCSCPPSSHTTTCTNPTEHSTHIRHRTPARPQSEYRVVVPARHAYSHSASVGSRYTCPVGNRPAARSCSVSFAQYATASSQLTQLHRPIQVARVLRGRYDDGLFPITARYSRRVTSYFPIQNPFVNVTRVCGPSQSAPPSLALRAPHHEPPRRNPHHVRDRLHHRLGHLHRPVNPVAASPSAPGPSTSPSASSARSTPASARNPPPRRSCSRSRTSPRPRRSPGFRDTERSPGPGLPAPKPAAPPPNRPGPAPKRVESTFPGSCLHNGIS